MTSTAGRRVSPPAPSRPAPRRGRPLPAGLLALASLAVAVCGLLLSAGPAAAYYGSGDDWRHVESTLADLRRDPPSTPVVYLLGGSAARECISTEPAWQAAIKDLGGGSVRAFNLGSSSQSYHNDLQIVANAPAVPTIVLIGLNLGRYTSIPRNSAPAPAPATRSDAVYDSHRFHDGQQLSVASKRALLHRWLAEKYPKFRARYAGNERTLRTLIAQCQALGFYPVLVELPMDLPVIGHSLDAPRHLYQRGARAAAQEAGIPYVDFLRSCHFVDNDFVDLWHLVEPGRAKYVRQLSRLVVTTLRQYGLSGQQAAP